MLKQSQICLWQKKLLQKLNNFRIFGKTPLDRGFVFLSDKYILNLRPYYFTFMEKQDFYFV